MYMDLGKCKYLINLLLTENKLECFVKASEYYNEAKSQIRIGGLSDTDPVYKDIVKFHKRTLKVLNDERRLEQIKQFYQVGTVIFLIILATCIVYIYGM
jgi:hypothetical protein